MPTMTDLLTPMRRETDHTKFVGRLADLAKAQQDFVIPQSSIRMRRTENIQGGESQRDTEYVLTAPDGSPFLLPEGVASRLVTRPTRTAFRQVAERLRIPVPYLDRLVDHDSWKISGPGGLAEDSVNRLAAVDERSALVRLWHADDGWVLRSVLSDKYQAIDNYRVLTAVADGFGGNNINLGDCEVDVDLTADRFRMRIAVPQIQVAAPDLLDGYRMPFSMDEARDVHAPAAAGEVAPVMWAGIVVENSETGHGRFIIRPRIVVKVCRNGLTRDVEFARTHVGARLDEGVVDWSDTTRQNALELIRSQVADAVQTFCSAQYVEGEVAKMRAAKGTEVVSAKAAVDTVAKTFSFSEDEHEAVLNCFARGGDQSVLGVGQAVTAAAQLVEDGDRQSEIEAAFWQIVESPQRFVGAA